MSPFSLRLLLIGIVGIGGNVGKFWSVYLTIGSNDLLPSVFPFVPEVITTAKFAETSM